MREQAEKNVKEYRAVNRLPYEILSEIFLACQKDYEEIFETNSYAHMDEYVTSLDTRQIPWTLSQVSGQWRSVAVSLPPLWSYLGLLLRPEDKYDATERWASIRFRLGLQLHRSATYPLFVSFRSTFDLPPAHSIFSILKSSVPRWKELLVRSWGLRAITHLRKELRSLETIHIENITEEDVAIFQFSPRLCGLVSSTVEGAPSSFEHITKFRNPSIMSIGTRQNIKNLMQLTRLENCSLFCLGVDLYTTLRHMVHPHLRILSLRSELEGDETTHHVSQFLDHATFPALETLEIYGQVDIRNSLISFFRRSQPPLTTLIMHSISFVSKERIHILLDALPYLESLVLRSCYVFPLFHGPLMMDHCHHEIPVLIPRLKVLAFDEYPEPGTYGVSEVEEFRLSRPDVQVRWPST